MTPPKPSFLASRVSAPEKPAVASSKASRFYTATDFKVAFTKAVKPGMRECRSRGKVVFVVKIGEPDLHDGWDEIRFNPADRWLVNA